MSPPAHQRLLPTLLAGPVLRRTERARVSIWLATSTPVRPRVEIFRLGSAGPRGLTAVGGATAETLALGPRLFVHLAGAVPDEGAFPTDELLAYDVELQADGSAPVRLGGLGLLQGAGALAYAGLPLPTFFIRERVPALNVMHGSCRLLHGEGEDSLLSGDELLARTAPDVAQRPSALFLTGDQIYADDVAGALIGHLREPASELMGL